MCTSTHMCSDNDAAVNDQRIIGSAISKKRISNSKIYYVDIIDDVCSECRFLMCIQLCFYTFRKSINVSNNVCKEINEIVLPATKSLCEIVKPLTKELKLIYVPGQCKHSR